MIMRYLLAIVVAFVCCQHAFSKQSFDTTFVGSREGDPQSLVKNVSTIHGDYSELDVDLCVAGPDPLIVSRFYTSRDHLNIATFGGWRFQPQTLFLICPNPDRDYQTPQGRFEYLDIYVGTPDGSLLKFSGFQNWENPAIQSKFFVDLEEDEVGICNTAKGSPSCWTNIKNHVLCYEPKSKSFTLHLSSGGRRIYVQGSSAGQFLLNAEVLASGNQITYAYDQEHRVKQMNMNNSSGNKLISWVTFEYGTSVVATASDGTTSEYFFEKDPSGIELLTEVKSSILPPRNYQYQLKDTKALLTRKELPDGRYIEIHYERSSPCRVVSLVEPLNGSEVSTTSFTYGKKVTEVQSPLDRKTFYYYDGNHRLIALEETLNNETYRTRKKHWGEKKDRGNLVSFSIEDSAKNILYYKTFSYDNKGNILEECEYGNLSGQSPDPIIFNKKGKPKSRHECLSKKYTYKNSESEDIVSQINEQGNGAIFAYMPGTAILKRKEIHQKNTAKKRFYYEYNEDGALTRTIADNGNTRDINDPDYDDQKFITWITPKQELPNVGAPEIIEERAFDHKSKTEILLKKTVNHFDTNGHVIQQDFYDEEDVFSYSLENAYDARGMLTLQKDTCGNQSTCTYDENKNLIQEATVDLTIQYEYDLQNHLIAVIQSGENCPIQKTTFTFDQMGNKTKEIDALGNQTVFHHDCLGRLIEKTTVTAEQTSKKATWSYSYNCLDQPITTTDPLGNPTAVEYNIRGNPSRIATDGKEEFFFYSLEGSLHRHILPQGIKKTIEYDYLGRESTVNYFERESNENYKTDTYYYDAFQLIGERSSDRNVKYIYNSKGQLTQSITAKNGSNVYVPISNNRISEIKNGEIVDFAYDTLGRLIETKKWKDATHYTLYAQRYDALGQIIEKRIEDERGKILYKKQFTYTPSGQLLSEIGFPNNQETVLAEYSYDSFQRLSQVKRGKSIWDITYENLQGVLKKTLLDPLGSVTEESYNYKGFLLSRVQKGSKSYPLLDEQYTYDSLNNLIEEKISNFAISYTYTPEALCQTISLVHNTPSSFWRSAKNQTALQCSLNYNDYRELTNSEIPSFQKNVEYTYDYQGKLSSITYEETPNEQTSSYSFTSNERTKEAKVVHDKRFTLNKTYDKHDKILTEKVKDTWGSYDVIFKYDDEGFLTQITLPDHSSIHYIYEGPFVSKIRRLSKEQKELYSYEVIDRDLMGNVLHEILPNNAGARKNVYDAQGRKVEVLTDFFSEKIFFDLLGNPIEKITMQGKNEITTVFTYDALSQLASESGHSYQYDAMQNLTLKDGTSYTIAPYNQVVKADNISCEYDKCGNLKSLADSSGTLELQFDALGRLIIAQTPDGKTARYTYDPNLRRMSKSINKDEIERYFYLEGFELGALDEHGNIKALRIPINPNALESTSIVSIELESEVYVPLTDLQRNIRFLIHAQRHNIVESYDFSAFGDEKIYTSGKQVARSRLNNPWRFQGKRHDSETGLIYYGARYYSPKLHKWISPDPIGSHDALNLYLFCRNNPLKYYDPWGFVSISEDCECRNHDHPGYHNRPPECICICEQNAFKAKMSGVIIAAGNFAADTWNNPRFQGGLQAFGGLTEAMIGGGMALGSVGVAAPVGGLVMAHGLDHFFTGMQIAFSGKHRTTLSEQLLQTTGMPAEWASFTNDVLSIGGTMGGMAIIRAGSLWAFPNFQSLPLMLQNKQNLTTVSNSTLSKSWTNSINPFKGKTFEEIDQMLRAKGFTTKGPNPLQGKGSYFSPTTNRKYYLDYAGKTYKGRITELPHVDVQYNIPINGIEKQRFPIGECLYGFE